jgi:hypothetical protein
MRVTVTLQLIGIGGLGELNVANPCTVDDFYAELSASAVTDAVKLFVLSLPWHKRPHCGPVVPVGPAVIVRFR